MAEAIFMPRLGQSVESCIITQWFKQKGDQVNEGDLLFAYETDKAAFEEEAKVSGILLDVFYEEGDEVPVLANVAVIGNKGESTEKFRTGGESVKKEDLSPQEDQEIPAGKEAVTIDTDEEPNKDKARIKISPRARNMAGVNKISISEVAGSGPNGRIIARDIEKIVSSKKEKPAEIKLSKSVPASNLTGDDFEIKPLTNIRKIIASSMLASLQNSAQLTHHTGADARKILDLRKRVKKEMEKGNTPDITLNDIICFALIKALIKLPAINSHFINEGIKTFRKVHLGIAVDTERGLMVPVLKNADDYSLRGLSSQLKTLTESCRKGTVEPDLLRSTEASFTISNLGALGVELFTPVINLPQAGILGVNTITYRPADMGDGTIGFVPYIGLSLTYDHRVLDGAPASVFLREIKLQIENFESPID